MSPSPLRADKPVGNPWAELELEPTDVPEPDCYTCGRTRSQCRARLRREAYRGGSDLHEFETREDAERRRRARNADN
jgi:hypothetical protein